MIKTFITNIRNFSAPTEQQAQEFTLQLETSANEIQEGDGQLDGAAHQIASNKNNIQAGLTTIIRQCTISFEATGCSPGKG